MPGAGHSTTNYVHRQVQSVYQVSHQNAEANSYLAKNFAGWRISIFGQVVNQFCAELRVRFFQIRKLRSVAARNALVCHPDHSGCGREHFGTTEAAALAARSIGIDGDVTKFS